MIWPLVMFASITSIFLLPKVFT